MAVRPSASVAVRTTSSGRAPGKTGRAIRPSAVAPGAFEARRSPAPAGMLARDPPFIGVERVVLTRAGRGARTHDGSPPSQEGGAAPAAPPSTSSARGRASGTHEAKGSSPWSRRSGASSLWRRPRRTGRSRGGRPPRRASARKTTASRAGGTSGRSARGGRNSPSKTASKVADCQQGGPQGDQGQVALAQEEPRQRGVGSVQGRGPHTARIASAARARMAPPLGALQLAQRPSAEGPRRWRAARTRGEPGSPALGGRRAPSAGRSPADPLVGRGREDLPRLRHPPGRRGPGGETRSDREDAIGSKVRAILRARGGASLGPRHPRPARHGLRRRVRGPRSVSRLDPVPSADRSGQAGRSWQGVSAQGSARCLDLGVVAAE